ncbi:hypothetical protein CRV00_08895 [Malaciobacter molluscorum]|uniref:sensor histidine kinase n=1 Tax=Malaciobacter molluscorum TaxID=1032072 RepID=UPI00100BB6D7|nr:HAMP domain-containing sensor histidine kinase [Malaciobacter molluscorum]RXJ93985.1 hypothetical protein CRV00_08895 [Malaciobacter molluscorum]
MQTNINNKDIEAILNSLIEGTILVKNGFIENVNDALIQILEYKSKDELIGNLATGVLIPSTTEKFLEFNKHIFQEVNLVSNYGDLIPAILKINDIKIQEQDYKIVTIIDLREFREKDTLLFKQSRLAAMGEMISMIAHQWRQPLSAMSSILAKLKIRTLKSKNEEILNFNKEFDNINNYIQYMSKTIDDFRNFFKDDKQKEYLDINDVIEITITMIKPILDSKGIKINVNKKEELNKIFTFKNELIQIILNILNNSIDAFEENNIKNGKIDINLSYCENYLRIVISDNAGGIPENIISKVFEPYFTTKHEKNGTGLGLYMCKVILEKHFSGTINAKNIENGSSFSIDIRI